MDGRQRWVDGVDCIDRDGVGVVMMGGAAAGVDCGRMLGLWTNCRDLEPMIEWDCAFLPPPLPPGWLKMCRMTMKIEHDCCGNSNDGDCNGG